MGRTAQEGRRRRGKKFITIEMYHTPRFFSFSARHICVLHNSCLNLLPYSPPRLLLLLLPDRRRVLEQPLRPPLPEPRRPSQEQQQE